MTCWPNGLKTKPYVTSSFGPRRAPVAGASTYHRGTDMVGFGRIRAVAPGRVVVAGTPRGWSGGGVQVWIQHAGFFTKSLHMRAGSLAVSVGDIVEEDADLGAMGRTGTATDVHLHFELTPGDVHYSNTGQVDPVPFLNNLISSTASGGGLAEGDADMPLDDNDRKFLIQLGADIVAQTKGPVQADLNSVHQSVLAGTRAMADAVAAIRADINYVHTLSPYSLKAILEASRGGEITLTDAQTKAIGGQLAAASVAGIDAALRDDFDGVKALLKSLPRETIAALKSAL